jgi:apolipoprotein N-acyltransferase
MTIAARVLSVRASLDALRGLSGWRRWLVCFAAGVGAALAQAPFYVLPLLAVGWTLFVIFTDNARQDARAARAGFAIGWWFGFGYFLPGLYWLGNAFLVQAEEFAWMAPFAMSGLPAFLALFYGAAGALVAKLKIAGARRILAAAAIVMAVEYGRGHILTGLPWNLPGQAFAGTAMGAQSAAWWGAYGLSLVALLLAMAPAAFLGQGRSLLKGALATLGGTGVLFALGAARLALVNPGDHPDVFVRIVQPNIPQREKIDNDLWFRNYQRHITLSSGSAPVNSRMFILWPENAVPVIDEVREGLQLLSEKLPKNAVLLTGAVRREKTEAGRELYYNSIAVIPETPAGRVAVAHYDKHHLVPFGEYLPLEGLLRAVGLAQLAPYDDGFTKGAGPRTMNAGGPSFAPLVCYEAIFPGRVYPKGERPEWIATVTNDGWFGDSSGPRQHLDQARLRVVETGLPMARSANTGVSALFDATGRVRNRIPLYETGVIDAPLPRAFGPTLYAGLGDLSFFLMSVLAFGIGIFPARTRR